MPPKDDEIDDIDLNEGTSPPGPPFVVEITDFDATSASLKWLPPLEDGGTPVTGYIIESHITRSEDEWMKGEKIKATKYPSGSVNDLTAGAKYEFRVVAVNRAGKSKPSKATRPQVIKAEKASPKIDRKVIGDKISCKVNQQIVLEVPVEGAPEPKTSWWFGDIELKPKADGSPLKVVHSMNITKLMFIPAKRPMMGKYTLRAKNKWGEDEVEVQINVYGRPEMPRGPLTVSDVTKRTCLLQWQFPDDDGGHPITHYEVEKMDLNNEQWLPVGTTKGLSYGVKNLAEGKVYKFLVRAVNQDGDSPDLITEGTTLAKNPFDPPSPPGKPIVTDWGENFAELEWRVPESDGSAGITEYQVEIRNCGKRVWVLVGRTKAPKARVSEKITAGNEYQFRVVAINKGGQSESSKSSDPILARTRFIKPKIDRELLLKETMVHAGQTLRLETEILASPSATVTWEYPNGSDIVNDDRAFSEIDDEGYRVSLCVKNMTRADGGNYKIVARNDQGYDDAEIRVDVLGPPSKPQGPIGISGVTPSGCKLTWRKPLDNGGSPLLYYNIERKDLDKDLWLSCGKASGKLVVMLKEIEFDVTGLHEGQVYMFRVAAVNAQGESQPLESNIPVCAKHPLDPPSPPYGMQVVDWSKKWAKLEWNVYDQKVICHYVIEMQEQFLVPKDITEETTRTEEASQQQQSAASPVPPQSSSFGREEDDLVPLRSPISSMPTLMPVHEFQEFCTEWMTLDVTEDNTPEVKLTDLTEGNKYKFRVRAVNGAGSSLSSEPTEEIVCKLRKQKPMIDHSSIISPVVVSRGQNIKLTVKVTGEPNPKKSWSYGKIEIKQCPTVDITDSEKGSKLLMLSARRDDTGSYTLRATNEHGEDSVTINVVVIVPPDKPRGLLKIYDVFAEGCTCEWTPPIDDGGSPITHYVLEKIDSSHSQWTPCGRTNSTSCKIIWLTPGKDYRLQVKAVNSEGESDPLPGVDSFFTENPWGPPTACGRPYLRDYDFDYFEVKWDPPKNDGGSRVTGYQVEMRLYKDNNLWIRAAEVKMQMERAIVTGIEMGNSYVVRVRAINAGGPGPWSLESERLRCKYKALKPKVTFAYKDKELVVKTGETLFVEAYILGEPPVEEILWTQFNGRKILTHDPSIGVYIDNSKPYISFLQKDSLTRRDCGVLTCTAENMNGKDSGSFTLKTISRPSVPDGILEVSKVHRSGCRLRWLPSKDDGGLPIEYRIKKYLVAADAWTLQGITSATTYDVNDLEQGREYMFCVRAVNSVGESEGLSTVKAITAKNNYTIPMPPSAPVVTDWSELCMVIEWKEPIDDGGAPLHGYHVEAKSVDTEGEWHLWEMVDANACKAKLEKLIKGREYQFRVIAINKAGKSEPSHPSRPKEAKLRKMIPYIDAKTLHDVVAVAGDRVRIDLPIFGEPPPEIVWTYNTETILESTPDRSISIINSETHTKLVLNATSAMSALYTLTVKNDSGSDSAKFELKVLDRPSPPESLNTSVTEDLSVNLLWKKSKNDGGAPVEYYQVERYEKEQGSWLACGKSKDNTWNIKGLPVGHEYKFKVCAVNKYGDSDPLIGNYVTIEEITAK